MKNLHKAFLRWLRFCLGAKIKKKYFALLSTDPFMFMSSMEPAIEIVPTTFLLHSLKTIIFV